MLSEVIVTVVVVVVVRGEVLKSSYRQSGGTKKKNLRIQLPKKSWGIKVGPFGILVKHVLSMRHPELRYGLG